MSDFVSGFEISLVTELEKEVARANRLQSQFDSLLLDLMESSKRSTYKWSEGPEYFPQDWVNEGRIDLANELITKFGDIEK